jgi:hypothetical protein
MQKKLPLFLCVLLLLLNILAFSVSAAPTSLVVGVEENSSAVRGGDFTLDVSLSNNGGFTLLDMKIQYGSSAMKLKSIEFADFLKENADVTCTQTSSGFTISTTGSPLTRNGTYVTLTFTLGNNVTLGSYPVTLVNGESGVKNGNESVNCQIKAGGVQLSCYHTYRSTKYAATCSSEGFTEYRCSECSLTYISDYTSKLAHTWRTVSTTSPTCTESGTLSRVCQVCGTSETVASGDPTGHTYSNPIVTEPTCQKEGYTTYTCLACGETFTDNVVPMVSHRYVESYRKESTCSETGYSIRSCIYCGLSYTAEVFATLEHQWVVSTTEASHTESGWTLYTCLVCGLSMRGDFTDELPYDLEYTVIREASCTESGVMLVVCLDGCGYSEEVEIPATGHSYGDWERVEKATLFQEGVWKTVCSVCGEEYCTTTSKLELTNASNSIDSNSFWTSVGNRILQSALYTVLAILIAVLLFGAILLILILQLLRRRRRDRSVVELERMVEEIKIAGRNDPPAPQNLPVIQRVEERKADINHPPLDFQELME